MEFTTEQLAVIRALPENLLISAAAGSGKTTVLAERIARRVAEGQADIRRLLVMTFTEAAAASMRRKIGDRLREELEAAPDPAQRAYLSRQLAALPRASVSTIHSFCLEAFRSFQYLLRDGDGQPLAEPGAGVVDPAAAGLLFADALDRVLTSFYLFCDAVADGGEAAATAPVPTGLPPRGLRPAPFVLGRESESAGEWTSSFLLLCDGFSPGRDDRALRELATSMHRFLRSMPDYEDWAAEALARLEEAGRDFASSGWADTLLRQARVLLDKSAAAIPGLLARLDQGIPFVKDARRNAEHTASFRLLLESLGRLADEAGRDLDEDAGSGWDRLVGLARALPDPPLPSASRDPEAREFQDDFLRDIPETVHLLTGRMATKKYTERFVLDTRPLFTRTAADIGGDIAAMVPPVRRLLETVLLADRVYSALKNQERGIDFSDFEHFALRILRTPEAQAYYRERYSEVYIDECQDTSSIQDEIAAGVASTGIFMVGDVKQSIYRFRHANPTLFLERSRRYETGDGGRLLGLTRNFRSTGSILEAVNRLFRQVMSEAAGEIDYNDAHALVPADGAPEGEPVELMLVGLRRETPEAGTEEGTDASAGSAPEEEPEKESLEGLAIAARIRGLLADGIPPEDIAILGRTHWICRHAAEALDRSGIPHTLSDGQGFLATPELLLLDALVSVLDNAAQDVPLAAVMRSRIHAAPGRPEGFSETDLLSVRVASDAAGAAAGDPPRLFFHESVAWYALNGSDAELRASVAGFIDWLDGLRAREPYLRLTELLSMVFERSGYLEYISQLPDGARRAEEVSLFCRWAENFESAGTRGLHRFAGHLAALRKEGADEPPFAADKPVEGRVRILTIHGSKGLEFPYVFVAGCARSLSGRPQGRLLFAERSGLGPDYVDPAGAVTYPTYARLAMERSLRNAALAEEMRLLYVAMTRAAQRLWLVAGVDLDPENGAPALARRLRSALAAGGGALSSLPAHLPLSARTFLDWILLSMARSAGTDWTPIAGAADPEGLLPAVAAFTRPGPETGRIRLSVVPAPDAAPVGGSDEAGRGDVVPDLRRAVAERLTGSRLPDGLDRALYAEAREGFDRLLLAGYRYGAAAGSAAKISVSELKRREQAYAEAWEAAGEEEPASPAPWLQGAGLEVRSPERALRTDDEETHSGTECGAALQGAERGTAIHAVLRYLELAPGGRIPDEDGIRDQIRRMAEHAMLTPREAAAMEPMTPAFARFVRSELAERIRAADTAGRAFRETPFTLRFNAADIHRDQDPAGFGPDDATLVQGIIDLWFEDPEADGIVLVDFKSDRLSGPDTEVARTLNERYRVQLGLYAAAIERAFKKPVASRWIWLFDRGRGYAVEGAEPLELRTLRTI